LLVESEIGLNISFGLFEVVFSHLLLIFNAYSRKKKETKRKGKAAKTGTGRAICDKRE
jgi:hypothetical protein